MVCWLRCNIFSSNLLQFNTFQGHKFPYQGACHAPLATVFHTTLKTLLASTPWRSSNPLSEIMKDNTIWSPSMYLMEWMTREHGGHYLSPIVRLDVRCDLARYSCKSLFLVDLKPPPKILSGIRSQFWLPSPPIPMLIYLPRHHCKSYKSSIVLLHLGYE